MKFAAIALIFYVVCGIGCAIPSRATTSQGPAGTLIYHT
jgi:hypothetical protein